MSAQVPFRRRAKTGAGQRLDLGLGAHRGAMVALPVIDLACGEPR
jgi:hypothetical protein